MDRRTHPSGDDGEQASYVYHRIFDPPPVQTLSAEGLPALEGPGDRQDGAVYVYKEDIILAVNVAIVTRRPLLVSGPPGCGKSSLATAVARLMGWRCYEQTITSRTRARDLQWTFDAVQRLNDAQAHTLPPQSEGLFRYIKPEVLWWAFQPESAARRGFPGEPTSALPFRGLKDPAERGDPDAPAVVLLDEIDKADPDVPNNLLVVLGSLRFTVAETGTEVAAAAGRAPLMILTDNQERDLPPAFLRRCICLDLQAPNASDLKRIGEAHLGVAGQDLYGPLAEHTMMLADEFEQSGLRPPSTAEYLDTVRACIHLGIGPKEEKQREWSALLRTSLEKRRRHEARLSR